MIVEEIRFKAQTGQGARVLQHRRYERAHPRHADAIPTKVELEALDTCACASVVCMKYAFVCMQVCRCVRGFVRA